MLTSVFVFLVASLDNLIRQICVKSRYCVMERCVVQMNSTQVDEAVNGSVFRCTASNKFYVCIYREYHFECKDMAVFSYLMQLNYIFKREDPLQFRSLLKFIAHLHGAKVSFTKPQF